MSKPNNRIALIGWSIAVAVFVIFVLTMGNASAKGVEGYLEGKGEMFKGKMISRTLTRAEEAEYQDLGLICSHVVTIETVFVDHPKYGEVEMPTSSIVQASGCDIIGERSPKLYTEYNNGVEVELVVNPDLSLAPLVIMPLPSDPFAFCTGTLVVQSVYLRDGDIIRETVTNVEVLDRYCTPATTTM